MGKLRIDLFVVLVLVIIVAGACAPNSKDYDTEEGKRQLSKLGKMMGVEFPQGSKIVYTESNGRNNEYYDYHVVYSPVPVEFDTPPDVKTPAEEYLDTLEKVSGDRSLGELNDKWTCHYAGAVGKGDWSAHQTNFETGSYLEISQVFLGWAN